MLQNQNITLTPQIIPHDIKLRLLQLRAESLHYACAHAFSSSTNACYKRCRCPLFFPCSLLPQSRLSIPSSLVSTGLAMDVDRGEWHNKTRIIEGRRSGTSPSSRGPLPAHSCPILASTSSPTRLSCCVAVPHPPPVPAANRFW